MYLQTSWKYHKPEHNSSYKIQIKQPLSSSKLPAQLSERKQDQASDWSTRENVTSCLTRWLLGFVVLYYLSCIFVTYTV